MERDTEYLTYLTRKEAAALCRVSVSTFDSLRRSGEMPTHDAAVGKHKLWRETTVRAFLEAGGTESHGRPTAA